MARAFAIACLLIGVVGLIYLAGGWVSVVGGIGGAFVIVYLIGLAVTNEWGWPREMIDDFRP